MGIAGGAEKCRYVKEELKFDACIDYKAGNLAAELAAACPDGIDIYFENVGGEVTKAVAPLLNKGARVPVCGYISNYNDEDITKAETPFMILKQLDEVPEHRFFVVTEWRDHVDLFRGDPDAPPLTLQGNQVLVDVGFQNLLAVMGHAGPT